MQPSLCTDVLALAEYFSLTLFASQKDARCEIFYCANHSSVYRGGGERGVLWNEETF